MPSKTGPTIVRVSGPTVQAGGMGECFMHEIVRVGEADLPGEVIRIENGIATVQVYEDTMGLGIGDPVRRTGELLSVELGPGLLGSIFDGIQRPLRRLALKWGDFIAKGAEIERLDRKRIWPFVPAVKKGDSVSEGHVIGTVRETELISHKILVPVGVSGTIEEIGEGNLCVTDTVAKLEGGREITMLCRWNIRSPRPIAGRLPFNVPIPTGQRILDTLFPIAEGGSAIIPGGFGTGKTVLEQTISKHAKVDVIVYVGCGERGNEMAEVLGEFTELSDPYTGRSLMERTILIANTSNMPVAAREASIYTGVTIAEYYRDQGYGVALLADSTSRWAEALREISSRMEEMPGEQGYPTYLASRIGAFYERAGRVRCLGRPDETGSVTIIGAVSPPGGDFSEPVTQASMRVASTLWALDYDLAHQRHFPAISWLTSYSLSSPALGEWFSANVSERWTEMVARLNVALQREEELLEIAKIVGIDAMGDGEKVELEGGRILRQGYLHQSSYHTTDAFCSYGRQEKLLLALLDYMEKMKAAADSGVLAEDILAAPTMEGMIRLKEIPEKGLDAHIAGLKEETEKYFKTLETE